MALRTAAVLATGAMIGFIGGCDGSGVDLVSDAGDTAIPPADTVGARCTASDECDDGEACNCVEWCDAGSGRCAGGGRAISPESN